MVGGVLWRWRRRWWGNRSGLFGDSSGLVAMGRWVDGGGASLEAGETAVATALVTRLEPRVVKTSKRQPVTAVVIVGRRGLRWCLWCAAMVYLLVANTRYSVAAVRPVFGNGEATATGSRTATRGSTRLFLRRAQHRQQRRI